MACKLSELVSRLQLAEFATGTSSVSALQLRKIPTAEPRSQTILPKVSVASDIAELRRARKGLLSDARVDITWTAAVCRTPLPMSAGAFHAVV